MKLTAAEFIALRKKFTDYLNGFETDSGLKLMETYFNDHEVASDIRWYGMYRYLTIEMLTDDDGGPSMLFLHTSTEDILDIEFACWTFDTTTTVWILNHQEKQAVT